MKFKVKNKGRFIFTLILLLLLTPISVFAAEEGVTMEVKGYEDMGLDKIDLSVSNVTKTVDPKSVDENLDAYFATQSPAVVTTLNDAAIFSVYKMVFDGSKYVAVDQPIPFSGKVKIWVPGSTDPAEEVPKIIDAKELKNYEVEMPVLLKGCSVTLSEPGYYHVYFAYEALAGSTQVFIDVEGESTQTELPAVEETASAKPTASKVLVNGSNTSFDAYNINGNNYFKLRDLAKIVNGTEKQFQVEWNTEIKAIDLISNHAYTAVGGEMTKGDGKAKQAVLNTAEIYQDGVVVSLTAYNINGNNYFKLRDIASAFNIGITWDSKTNTVGINTAQNYIAE